MVFSEFLKSYVLFKKDADDTPVPDWSDDTTNMNDICILFKTKFTSASDQMKDFEAMKQPEEFLSPKPNTEDRVSSSSFRNLKKKRENIYKMINTNKF